MKKIKFVLIAVILVVFLSGCDVNFYTMNYLNKKAEGHTLFYGDSEHDFSTIQYMEHITPWIRNHIHYKADEGGDKWSNPKQILYQGFGDCDDYTTLWMNIAYVRFGIKTDFALCNSQEVWTSGAEPWTFYYEKIESSRAIKDINHAIVILDGIPFEPQNNMLYPNAKVDYICTFDNFFTN